MNDKLAAMSTMKRMLLDGHMVTVVLTEHQADNDTYHGVAFRARSTDTRDIVPNIQAVHGLRPYPYADRPDYAWQFVEAGQDEQPLLDIASGNAAHHQETIDAGKQDRIDQVNAPEQVFDPRDTDKDGTVSKAEKKAWNRENR
jgi:hypothetical protein